MPYVTDNDSKAVRRIAEIERELQEAKAELDQWIGVASTPKNAAEVMARERFTKTLTDRIQALTSALEMQRALASATVHEQERMLATLAPKRLKDFGYRPVSIQFLGGVAISLMARYWCRSAAAQAKGRGYCFGLLVLGVCDRCSPTLASEVAQLAAALSSFEDAQARLRQMGVRMSVQRIAKVSYHFAVRVRQQQELAGMGIEGSLAGKRVVISLDGGRLRIRTNKRGKKTKKGRNRYHTDWREPKLLVVYVVNEKGRIEREFAPVIDGTLRGPDEIFHLLGLYLAELRITEAAKILFIADGAKWIWTRVAPLLERLGIEGRYRGSVSGVGRFLPRDRTCEQASCPENQVEIVGAKTLGQSATPSLMAWRSEGIPGGD